MARGGQVIANVASPDAEAEIEALRRQAAQLRASATALEQEQEAQRLLENERFFRAFDRDGSQAVDAVELRLGLKDLWGMEVQEDVAARLLKLLDLNGSGAIELGEFDIVAIEPALERLGREDAEREAVAAAEEAKRQEELELQRQLEEYERNLPGENQDTGILARLLSVIVYALPLADIVKLGAPLILVLPAGVLDAIFVPLVPNYQLFASIPFATLIVFVALQSLAGNEKLPALARYNMQQAVQLDLLLIVPMLLSTEGPVFDALCEPVGSAIFLPGILAYFATLPCVAYAVVSSLLGEAPRGIPVASAMAEKAMGMVRPGSDNGSSPK